VTLCTTDDAILLFAAIGGTPDAGGTWSGPSPVVGGQYDPATMDPGVYTYTIDVPPPCVGSSTTVTVTEVAPPNAGSDGALTLCISSPSASLFTQLGGTPQAGGVWSGPSPVLGGQFNPATMTAGVYTYTVNGTTPCPSDAATVTVGIVSEPDAGSPGAVTLCTTDDAILLFAAIGGTPDAGGTWSGPSPVVGGQYDPATMDPGVYTYTIDVPPPCVGSSTTVTVTEVAPPNAGSDGSLALCVSGPAVDLADGLGGAPDTGGTWSGPSAVFGGLFDPTSMSPGSYTYSVTGTPPCPAAVAVVEVSLVEQPFAGGPGALTACSSGPVEDLFTRLEGSPDQGGTWTTPDGTAFNGNFDPQTMQGGTYTYTIAVPLPCISSSSTVEVTLIAPPDAGIDGELVLCSSDEATALFPSILGTPQPGGSWQTATGAGWSGTFDPSTDTSGDYLYIASGASPCPADTALVSVAIVLPANAGSDDVVNLCITGAPEDLFPLLGNADAGGTWMAPDGGTFQGTFDPATDLAGNYTYTVVGAPPCPAANAVVTVQVLSDADAGGDGAVTLCQAPGQVQLFGLLGGSPDAGGIWIAPSGEDINGTLDPSSAIAGSYTYVVVVPQPCVNDTAIVDVTLEVPANAGADGSLTLCSSDGASELFDQLNGTPDAGGSWSFGDGFVDGNYDPTTDPQGIYIYTVAGGDVCPDASAAVTVTVNLLPDAGDDGSTTVCPEAASFALLPLLGGTPDVQGSWSAPDGSPFAGIFDPSTDTPGIYTYTVTGSAPCPNASASATVIVQLVTQPDAGPPATSCSLEGSVLATGSWASGSWSGDPGLDFTNSGNAGTTVSAIAGGSYTAYWSTFTSEGCAAMDSVQLTFTDPVAAVVSTSDPLCNGICTGTATVAATGGNVAGGAYNYGWSSQGPGGTDIAEGLCAGNYTVTVADTNGCATTVAFVINEPAPLAIDLVFDVDETCPGTCDGRIVVVDPAGTLFSLNGSDFQPTNLFGNLCPGDFTVWMQDANGCVASASATIGSPPPVIAGFTQGPDTLFIDQTLASFTNTSSSNATNFVWDFGTGEGSTSVSPSYAFPGGLGGTYTVCLTALDANGCSDSVCAIVPVLDRLLVFVANAFTPNGDGFNEGFKPIFNLPHVADYEFMVFDRWGERIFNSRSLDEAWNGTYGGTLVESEVYVWKLTCRDQFTGELIERLGHVSVLY
jgi:gliding motility-associated-like protein